MYPRVPSDQRSALSFSAVLERSGATLINGTAVVDGRLRFLNPASAHDDLAAAAEHNQLD